MSSGELGLEGATSPLSLISDHTGLASAVTCTHSRTLCEGKWLRLVEIDVRREERGDCPAAEYVWESVERTTRSETAGVDACDVVAIVGTTGGAEPSVVLVFQHRPPAGRLTVEFPAGLIDEGESASDAAVRELREETGYVAEVVDTSCEVFLDPALSNENARLVEVKVTGRTEQDLEPEEAIACCEVPLSKLYETLTAYQADRLAIDARLFSWAHGFHAAMKFL